MRGFHVERKGGWDCHGLPVEIAVEQKLGFTSKHDIEELRHRRVQPAVPRVGLRVPRGLGRAHRADRLLGRPRDAYRTLDTDYIESVWWVLKQIWDKRPALRGLQGRPLLPALRHRALLARGRAGLQGRRGPVGLRALPGDRAGGRAARGRRAARLDDDAVDARRPTPRVAVDPDARPTCARGRRRRLRAGRGAASSACSARTREVARRASRARELVGAALRAAVPVHRRASYGDEGPHRAARRLRHRRGRHRHRAHRDRVRRGRLPARRRAGPDRRQPGAARRHLRRAHRPVRGPLRQGRRPGPRRGPARARAAAARRATTSTPTRTAGAAARRSSTTPSRPGTSAPRSCATGCWPPTRPSTGTREHIKHGRFGNWLENNVDWALVARALLGHAAAGLALRGRATPMCIGSLAELAERSRRARSRTCTARSSTTSTLPCADVRRARCAACPR